MSCAFERRLGKRGDGGKWACDPDQLLEHGRCAIASVGSENEWSFETEVLERYACDFVHTFDHTVYDPTPPRGATFHPLKLSAADDEAERTISVAGVVRMLPPGRVLDILKIDIEGGEYFMLAHNASLDAMARSVRVLMIEVHMCSNFVPEPDPDWEKLCSVNTPAAERLEPWACADYNASGYKEYRAHIKAEEERLAREEQERMRQWERDWGGEWGDGGEDLGWGGAVEEGLETWYAWAAQDQAAEDAEVEAGASTGRSNTTTEASDGNKNAAAMVNATTGRGNGDENATVQSTTIEAKHGEGDELVNAAVAAVLGVKGAERKGGGGTVGKDVSAGSATAPAVDGASGAAAAASVSAGGSTAEALPVLATGAQMRERFKAQLRVRPQRTARAGVGGVPAGPTTSAGRAASKKTGDATVDSVGLTASATTEDGSTIATQGQHATQPEHSKESTTETQTATHPSKSRHQAQQRRPELRPRQLLSRAEQQQRFHAQHPHVQHVAEEHGLDEGEEDGQEEGTRRLAESLGNLDDGQDGAGADSVLVGSEFDDYRGSFARLGEGAWDDALFEDGAGIGWGEDWISGRYSGDPWWMFEDGTASPYKYRLVRERGLPHERRARAHDAHTASSSVTPCLSLTSVLPLRWLAPCALARPRHDMRQWVARLGQRLYDRGFRTYHKEINIQHTDGCCLEFALVNTNLLLEQAGGAGSGKESDGMGDEEETRSRQRRQRSRRHGQHEERTP